MKDSLEIRSVTLAMLRAVVLSAMIWVIGGCRPFVHTEKVAEFYPNGNPKKTLSYSKKGELILVTTYHWNKIRATRQECENSIPHGLYERWDSNGDLLERGHYKKGLREGSFELFFRRNQPQGSAFYVKGKLHGERWEYFPNSKPRILEQWDNGIPVGTWEKWDSTGALQEQNTCHASAITGFLKTFYPNGSPQKISSCYKGNLHGASLEYYPNNVLKSRSLYRNGVPDSTWIWNRADGALWSLTNFHFGLRNGLTFKIGLNLDTLFSSIFADGTGRIQIHCLKYPQLLCADSSWQKDKLHGTVETWNDATLILTKETWASGQPLRTLAWKTDTLKQIKRLLLDGNWQNGKREGLWRTWFNNGKLKDSLYYHNNELWGTQSYFDSTGHLYMTKETKGKTQQVIVKTLNPRPILK